MLITHCLLERTELGQDHYDMNWVNIKVQRVVGASVIRMACCNEWRRQGRYVDDAEVQSVVCRIGYNRLQSDRDTKRIGELKAGLSNSTICGNVSREFNVCKTVSIHSKQ